MFFQLSEQQQSLRDAARTLAQKEFKDKAARWDQNYEYPEENHRKLAELGYLALSADEQYGGSGLGLVDVYLVVEEIAKVDMTTALLVHDQNVSPRIIASYGDEALRRDGHHHERRAARRRLRDQRAQDIHDLRRSGGLPPPLCALR
jgi:alkylation response protein AidB-like acyl-CoA dehydrogenase